MKNVNARISSMVCRIPRRVSLTCVAMLVALHTLGVHVLPLDAAAPSPPTGQASAESEAAEKEADDDRTSATVAAPKTIGDARMRSQLLHELIHGSLQVMHRDFFDDDAAGAIPSRSLEDVFAEMERTWDVRIRWMAVNTDAMNIDNEPQDDFERRAVEALADGAERFEATEEDLYRFAGPIRLSSQCLKCHVQNRTSLEDRIAGLVITMPLGPHQRSK